MLVSRLTPFGVEFVSSMSSVPQEKVVRLGNGALGVETVVVVEQLPVGPVLELTTTPAETRSSRPSTVNHSIP